MPGLPTFFLIITRIIVRIFYFDCDVLAKTNFNECPYYPPAEAFETQLFFLHKQFVFVLHALDGFLQKDLYSEVYNRKKNTPQGACDGNILRDVLSVGFLVFGID